MENEDLKRLVLAMALNAEMQGMIAENQRRQQEGIAQAYDEIAFDQISDQLIDLAMKTKLEKD